MKQGTFTLSQKELQRVSVSGRFGVLPAFCGDRYGVFVRNDDHWTIEEQLAGKHQPTHFGRALEQLGIARSIKLSTGASRARQQAYALLPLRS